MGVYQDIVQELFDYNPDIGVLFWKVNPKAGTRKKGEQAGYINNRGRLMVSIKGKQYLAHRLIWLYMYGVWPECIDHIDGNPLNNKLDNLRDGGFGVNSQNVRRPRGKNKYLGVSFHKSTGKYQASIWHNGKKVFLGLFVDPAEASQVYLKKKREIHPGCTI